MAALPQQMPDDFWPERWNADGEIIHAGHGPFDLSGDPVALDWPREAVVAALRDAIWMALEMQRLGQLKAEPA